MKQPRTYLDWNASAPLHREARAAMLAALGCEGNASSVHAEGRRARALVEDARERVAALVGAKPSEVVFTSGATEANNWVMRAGWDTIFLSGIEHDSVLAAARASAARLIEMPARSNGVVASEVIAEHVPGSILNGRTLVTLQMANNETGVLQPVADTAALAREHGLATHTDATQAAGRVPINFAALGVDLLSLSSHKLGGPKGVGALVVREDARLAPYVLGGGQERRRRAGTEPVAAISGFGAAAATALADLDRVADMAAQRDRMEQSLKRLAPGAIVIGEDAPRLANTTCIAWPGKLAETLVIQLDLAGIAVSAGAACSSGKVSASHVLAAMGVPDAIARSAIRVSLGSQTSRRDISRLLNTWRAICGDPARENGARGNEMPHGVARADERTLEKV